jgi:phospholipid-binding lipoprotein MlaA
MKLVIAKIERCFAHTALKVLKNGKLMKILKTITTLVISTVYLTACVKGTNPKDPYESANRKTHQFNLAFDATILKPTAKLYITIFPGFMRSGIHNFYNNINMIPTTANDLLQADFHQAQKDAWRFVVNSTLGIGGILEVADTMKLPPHSNDMSITLAKWGDQHSPYFVIPLLGPSTFRDAMGMMFNYALLTPYPYFQSGVTWSLVGVRYVDLRSQMLDTEKFMNDALDKYTFMRDAYLQHRHYLIKGEKPQDADDSGLYIAEDNNATTIPFVPKAASNPSSQ